MSDVVRILARRLGATIEIHPRLGPYVVQKGERLFKFFIPQPVMRVPFTRFGGDLGVVLQAAEGQAVSPSPLKLEDAWTTNILNLPWLYPILGFNPADPEPGIAKFAQELQQVFDLLPDEPSDMPPSTGPVFGNSWQRDRRGWLLAKLDQSLRD